MKSTRKHLLVIILLIALGATGCSALEQMGRSSSLGTDTIQYADFPEQTLRDRQGQVLIEVPPIYELMQVGLALTEASEAQPYRYTHPETEYYRKMRETFDPYQDHAWIAALNEETRSPTSYRAIFAYQFTPQGIEGPQIYGVDHLSAAFQPSLDLMADFAKETNFDAFYQQHQPFYQDEIQRYQDTVPVQSIWDFMEENFSTEVDSYHIVLSPLMVGTNNTIKFVDRENDFTEILLFVPSPVVMRNHPLIPEEAASQTLTRSVFTEIDHNYVNPATDRHLEAIDRAMRRLSDWHTGSGYPTAALKFNEYFTWAIFFPWAEQYYSGEQYEAIFEITVEHMNMRGFIQFEAFAEELIRLYRSNPEIPLEEQIPAMVAWMAEQN